MKYSKTIEMYFTGMVIADVKRSDGTSAGKNYFHNYPFESDSHLMGRAHKWADSRIKLLEEKEIYS